MHLPARPFASSWTAFSLRLTAGSLGWPHWGLTGWLRLKPPSWASALVRMVGIMRAVNPERLNSLIHDWLTLAQRFKMWANMRPSAVLVYSGAPSHEFSGSLYSITLDWASTDATKFVVEGSLVPVTIKENGYDKQALLWTYAEEDITGIRFPIFVRLSSLADTESRLPMLRPLQNYPGMYAARLQ